MHVGLARLGRATLPVPPAMFRRLQSPPMFPAMVLLTLGALLEVVSILAPHVPERRPHRHLVFLVVWILTFLAALHVMA